MLRQGHLGTVNEWVNVKVQVLTLMAMIYSTVNFLTLDGFRPLTLCLACSLDWIMWHVGEVEDDQALHLLIYFLYLLVLRGILFSVEIYK